MLFSSEFYVKSHFGKFFLSHPNLGIGDLEFSKVAIGEENILNNNQLLDVLGWTALGQLNGYVNGGVRRVLREINKFI